MRPPLTLVLWPGPGRIYEEIFLGRPLWQRTLSAARPLRAERTLLLLRDGPPPRTAAVEPVKPGRLATELGSLRGTLMLLPAELPCLTARTLKRLRAAGQSAARCLLGPGADPGAALLCGPADRIRPAFSARPPRDGIGSLASQAGAAPVASEEPEDLLRVQTASDWARAVAVLLRRKREELLSRGVLLDEPSQVRIDPEVSVGRGTRIHGWVIIEGDCRIGRGCEIGSFTHVVDSSIGDETIILDHCFIRSSRIGRRAQLGPFAHLRPESVLSAAAKVGNFVELKKTVIGRGSKVPHLSYVGDARVGRAVNVGAGTITCNFDGRLKHRTVIEDGAFIGSSVQLVAPVRVGRDAYVAAGSCIVEDVPAGSLAIARSRQVVKRGWARRRNP